MSESKQTFTPGPWSVSEMNRRGLYENDGSAVVMSESVRIASVDCHVKTKRGEAYKAKCPVRDANAALMAAAPELLEALKGVVAVADRRTVEFDKARAAIAKAESTTASST